MKYALADIIGCIIASFSTVVEWVDMGSFLTTHHSPFLIALTVVLIILADDKPSAETGALPTPYAEGELPGRICCVSRFRCALIVSGSPGCLATPQDRRRCRKSTGYFQARTPANWGRKPGRWLPRAACR